MRTYLSIATIITPELLDKYMSDSKNRSKETFDKQWAKYGKYGPILAKHAGTAEHFAAATATLIAIFETIDKKLSEETNA